MNAQIRDQAQERLQTRVRWEGQRFSLEGEVGIEEAFENLFLLPPQGHLPQSPIGEIPIHIGTGNVNDRPVNFIPLPTVDIIGSDVCEHT